VIVGAEEVETDETEFSAVLLSAVWIWNVFVAERIEFITERCHASVTSAARIMPGAIAAFVSALDLEDYKNFVRNEKRGKLKITYSSRSDAAQITFLAAIRVMRSDNVLR
jgi:hypothetical protein